MLSSLIGVTSLDTSLIWFEVLRSSDFTSSWELSVSVVVSTLSTFVSSIFSLITSSFFKSSDSEIALLINWSWTTSGFNSSAYTFDLILLSSLGFNLSTWDVIVSTCCLILSFTTSTSALTELI